MVRPVADSNDQSSHVAVERSPYVGLPTALGHGRVLRMRLRRIQDCQLRQLASRWLPSMVRNGIA